MGVINRALNQLPIDQYGDIRFAKARLHQKDPTIDVKTSNHRIWYLDAPEYGNLGDQAIAYSMRVFCQENMPEWELLEFQEDTVLQYFNWIKKTIQTDDVIIMQGGGNLGDIYPRYEYIRRAVIRNFPNNKIVIFPQSISFSNNGKENREKKIFSEVYGNHKKLTVFARDSHSYKVIQKIIPDSDVRLCPDIVFYLTGSIDCSNKKGLGICLRQDSEKNVSAEEITSLTMQLRKKYGSPNQITTLCDINQQIIGALREQLVKEKLKEFASYEMIVTDRLHGMIFSYVTSTPCIALNNATGKSLYAYRDWLKDRRNVAFVKDAGQLGNVPTIEKSRKLNFVELKRAFTE